ncbi:S41 family peptidase [Aquimarina sp. 2304DJ70-9]|uniref:S41 family peptidase n=1 Tax=Aquimarina penaris TaxID=3231044 RepID=UPI0034637CD9
MQRILFIVLIGINIHTLLAQKPIDSLGIKEDFKIFESILKKGHPSLYEYINQDSLDYLFKTTKESLSNDSTDIDLYKKMLQITSTIKDGHLLLFAPNSIKSDQYYFPLILKIINTNLYTDTDDFGIPVGSKIKLINGKKVSKILERLKKYAASDGNNLTGKYRNIELKFGLYFAYEYGIEKQFIVEYTTPAGEDKKTTVIAESFVKVKLRNTKRNSYFAQYHKQKNGFDFFNKFIGNKDPFVYYKNELNTAILVVNSFGGDIGIFKSNLTRIFKEINKKKVRHLIIDVRNNDGGFRPNAIHLFSFLTKNVFKQITSEYVISLSVPEREYATRTFLNEKQFLKEKFENHPIYDGWKLTFDDMETIMVPDKNRFKGKVYVLAGGATFSAGSTFTLNVKNDPDMTLIGEETGGGYYFLNGEFPVYYEFPNSKISMVMSMEKISNYVKDKTIPKGSGVPPDKHIKLSIEDLIKGKDPQLDYIFRLIGG